ncbi:MAG: SDR family oxidoreductase [Thermoplasmata archaeon]|nr:SDR family oxidoreductase [Thermoplasmata archaeon]
MRVLVTGGAGYLGACLVPQLLAAGHEVTVLDRFFFGTEPLAEYAQHPRIHLVRDDVRWCDGRVFEGQEAVVDAAALSNDPAGAMDPWRTREINYLGRVRTSRLAREAGASRYLLTSSCSIYGFQDSILTEETTPEPLTEYARANWLAEQDTLPMASPSFCPTAVRFATLYGLSPRMRFDLAVNGMVLGGVRTHRIPVMKDGTQWRPFLHVRDAARAISEVLAAPPGSVRGRVFNVGSDEQNFQVRPLAELVAAHLREPPTLEWYGDPDVRSYRVSFARARSELGFTPSLTPADAAREIEQALRADAVDTGLRTKTVEWYRHLLSDPAAADPVRLRGVVL